MKLKVGGVGGACERSQLKGRPFALSAFKLFIRFQGRIFHSDLITGVAQVTRQVSQYGIKVSSWGSETFKIVTPRRKSPPETAKSVGLLSPL